MILDFRRVTGNLGLPAINKEKNRRLRLSLIFSSLLTMGGSFAKNSQFISSEREERPSLQQVRSRYLVVGYGFFAWNSNNPFRCNVHLKVTEGIFVLYLQYNFFI